VVVFLISKGGAVSFVEKWGEAPVEVQYFGKTYELFTSPWVHLSVTHIGLNMLSLFIVGPPVEAAVGRARYLVLYLGSAMGGSVAYFLIAPPQVSGAGASGAIFGIFGALFIVGRRRGLQTNGVIALIVVNLVLGFAIPGIGWQAHVGGLVAGTAMAAGFLLAERWRGAPARLVEGATCAAAALVMLGLMQFPCRHVPGIT
jgi:membrane associated rhomboid family serine protease